jgi:hypothetical protein
MSAAFHLPILRRCLFVALWSTSFTATSSYAAELDLSALRPSTLFVQAGIGDQSTRAYVAGATWNWTWRREYSFVTATGYFEADVGRWSTNDHGVRSSAWVTQVGLTPVLRLQASGAISDWFAEIGVGANYIVPLYRTSNKRFSTEFNFGDHFGIGHLFGEHREHELTVRVQHFSNAGIKHPNPGKNFLQLRYSRRL